MDQDDEPQMQIVLHEVNYSIAIYYIAIPFVRIFSLEMFTDLNCFLAGQKILPYSRGGLWSWGGGIVEHLLLLLSCIMQNRWYYCRGYQYLTDFTTLFSFGSRQEVNTTWYPKIEEPIKSHKKHYSLLLYILNHNCCGAPTRQRN